jgi:hypothetical protein
MTVATDSALLYASERQHLARRYRTDSMRSTRRDLQPPGRIVGDPSWSSPISIANAFSISLLRLGGAAGRGVDDFDYRKDQRFWRTVDGIRCGIA